MKEVKIHLKDELNDQFRRTAMDTFGYGRGSISKAAEEAILQWCERRAAILRPVNRIDPPVPPDERQPNLTSEPAEGAHGQISRPSLPTGS